MATNYNPKDRLIQQIDDLLEGVVTALRDTSLTEPGMGQGGVPITSAGLLTRARILKLIAQRALRKTTQSKMRAETRDSRTSGVIGGSGYGI